MNQRVAAASSQAVELLQQFSQQGENLSRIASRLGGIFAAGGQLLVAGSGRTQPLAQLLASQFTYQLGFERPALPALALGSDPTLAGIMRPGAAEQLLVRHYRALGSAQHLLLVLATGQADNGLRLLIEAVSDSGQPIVLIAPEGAADPLYQDGLEACVSLGARQAARSLELTMFAGHLLCELVEAELFGV